MDATITAAATFFESMLAHAHFVAIVLGVIIAILATQFLKYPMRLWFHLRGIDEASRLTPELAAGLHRWLARFSALVIGFVATYTTWPGGPLPHRICWAVLAGLAAPIVYSLATARWPALGEKFTADRVIPKASPECVARDHTGNDDVQ